MAAGFPRVSDLREVGRGANLILEATSHPWYSAEEDYTAHEPQETRVIEGLPWWASGQECMLPMQGAGVQSLVLELDLACCS